MGGVEGRLALRDRGGHPYYVANGSWYSPARQAKKALGLSGRQLVKFRKQLRREEKAQ